MQFIHGEVLLERIQDKMLNFCYLYEKMLIVNINIITFLIALMSSKNRSLYLKTTLKENIGSCQNNILIFHT